MDNKETICDVCERNLTFNGHTAIGISLPVKDISENKDYFPNVYPEIELGKTYNICFVCLLKKLGVKRWKKN